MAHKLTLLALLLSTSILYSQPTTWVANDSVVIHATMPNATHRSTAMVGNTLYATFTYTHNYTLMLQVVSEYNRAYTFAITDSLLLNHYTLLKPHSKGFMLYTYRNNYTILLDTSSQTITYTQANLTGNKTLILPNRTTTLRSDAVQVADGLVLGATNVSVVVKNENTIQRTIAKSELKNKLLLHYKGNNRYTSFFNYPAEYTANTNMYANAGISFEQGYQPNTVIVSMQAVPSLYKVSLTDYSTTVHTVPVKYSTTHATTYSTVTKQMLYNPTYYNLLAHDYNTLLMSNGNLYRTYHSGYNAKDIPPTLQATAYNNAVALMRYS